MNENLMMIIECIAGCEGSPTTIKLGYTISGMSYRNGFVVQNSNGSVLREITKCLNIINENRLHIMMEMNMENNGLLITSLKK